MHRSTRHRFIALGFCDVTNETIASTVCSLDKGWRLRVVTKSLADLTNGDFEDRLADKRSRPNSVEKLLFCDELARTS